MRSVGWRWVAVAVAVVVAWAAVVAATGGGNDQRLRRADDLASLIEAERSEAQRLLGVLDELRLRSESLREDLRTVPVAADLDRARLEAGIVAVTGPGLEVTLDDSSLPSSPTGNVNDLVIHSQDVQGVVNALWRAGAEALAINDERVISTSAVLCVGNTLLLNGTVHSPPYRMSAVGADRRRFESVPAVAAFRRDADVFGLGYSVVEREVMEIPAFRGRLQPRWTVPIEL
ncbi:MAG TPA: DUF881 domain-containing protein [Acidimicrobiales bacterium]